MTASLDQLARLRTELALPLYIAMDDPARLAELEVLDKTEDRPDVAAWEVLTAIAPAERATLTAAQRADLNSVLNLGTLDLGKAKLRSFIVDIFQPPASFPVTGASLAALRTRPTSRARQLKLHDLNIGWITEARS